MFEFADKNKDGKLSYKEFKESIYIDDVKMHKNSLTAVTNISGVGGLWATTWTSLSLTYR